MRKRTTSYNEKRDYHTSIQKFGAKSSWIFILVTFVDLSKVFLIHSFQHENAKRESQGHFSAFSYGDDFYKRKQEVIFDNLRT